MTILNVIPMGKPRMTQKDKWCKREVTTRYWAFCNALILEINRTKLVPTNAFKIVFYLPIPASYSNKKKLQLDDTLHTKKFDLDNLVKSFCDALYQDDSGVNYIEMSKRYSLNPRIEVEFLTIK